MSVSSNIIAAASALNNANVMNQQAAARSGSGGGAPTPPDGDPGGAWQPVKSNANRQRRRRKNGRWEYRDAPKKEPPAQQPEDRASLDDPLERRQLGDMAEERGALVRGQTAEQHRAAAHRLLAAQATKTGGPAEGMTADQHKVAASKLEASHFLREKLLDAVRRADDSEGSVFVPKLISDFRNQYDAERKAAGQGTDWAEWGRRGDALEEAILSLHRSGDAKLARDVDRNSIRNAAYGIDGHKVDPRMGHRMFMSLEITPGGNLDPSGKTGKARDDNEAMRKAEAGMEAANEAVAGIGHRVAQGGYQSRSQLEREVSAAVDALHGSAKQYPKSEVPTHDYVANAAARAGVSESSLAEARKRHGVTGKTPKTARTPAAALADALWETNVINRTKAEGAGAKSLWEKMTGGLFGS